MVEFKLPIHLATLLVAELLFVVFIIGYGSLWRSLDHELNRDPDGMVIRSAMA